MEHCCLSCVSDRVVQLCRYSLPGVRACCIDARPRLRAISGIVALIPGHPHKLLLLFLVPKLFGVGIHIDDGRLILVLFLLYENGALFCRRFLGVEGYWHEYLLLCCMSDVSGMSFRLVVGLMFGVGSIGGSGYFSAGVVNVGYQAEA